MEFFVRWLVAITLLLQLSINETIGQTTSFIEETTTPLLQNGKPVQTQKSTKISLPEGDETLTVMLQQGAISGKKESARQGRSFYSFKGIPYAHQTQKSTKISLPEGDETLTVMLQQGAISGKKESAGQGRSFYSFKGIPYAQPPVGNLRLRDPVPASPWEGLRDGSKDVPVCPQVEFYVTMEDEDCLFLNVFTPRPFQSNLPVMVWIHGGYFHQGGANEFSPLPLLTKDIVLVVVQYRLGTLGFLSTEDDVLPGNFGLKDQNLALRWVQDNIRDLGGDPNKVTLFGESAGAASIHMQILSPKARGLSRRAILQSGTALSQWAIRTDHRKIAMAISIKYNCTDSDDSFNSNALLKCLQYLPLSDLVEMQFLFTLPMIRPVPLPFVMTPRVDGDFLPDHPAVLLKEARYNPVDIITGVNKHEGATTVLPFVLNTFLNQQFVDNFDIVAPGLMGLDKEKSPVYLARRTFDHFLGGRTISKETANANVEMISSLGFIWPNDEVTQSHANRALQGSRTYSYKLQYRGEHGFADIYGPEAGKSWITHADDLQYLFMNYSMLVLQQPEDLHIRDLMVDLWTNFALFGNPTPDDSLGVRWLPASRKCLQYLAIDSHPFMQDYDRAATLKFWRSLPMEVNELLDPHGTQIQLVYPSLGRPDLSCKNNHYQNHRLSIG